ncbi:766_t:CDS:2, partial [Rhizophagus irregularis]
ALVTYRLLPSFWPLDAYREYAFILTVDTFGSLEHKEGRKIFDGFYFQIFEIISINNHTLNIEYRYAETDANEQAIMHEINRMARKIILFFMVCSSGSDTLLEK